MIRSYEGNMETKKAIENASDNIISTLEREFPLQYPIENNELYYAFTLSNCAKESIKRGELKVIDYIAILAEVKEENEKTLQDYGAFGDLFEILIRCALVRKYSLVRWSMLSVKDIKSNDIVSKKFGNIEVGHNGKSLTFGTLFDYMDGDYNAFIYGVFSYEDKKEVYTLCKQKEYEKVLDYITSYSVYWANKYDFQRDMDNLTRGKGITVKGENVQIVYNEGKYNAFLDAIENGVFNSLYETLER